MFSFRSNAQLWAVTTDWSLLGRSKQPSTLRLQQCSNKENKQQLNRQTRMRRNTTLNPNILSGSYVFAHGNPLNILISGAQICQNTFPVTFKNLTADRSHFRTAANFLSLFTHKINVPKRLPPTPEPFIQGFSSSFYVKNVISISQSGLEVWEEYTLGGVEKNILLPRKL